MMMTVRTHTHTRALHVIDRSADQASTINPTRQISSADYLQRGLNSFLRAETLKRNGE